MLVIGKVGGQSVLGVAVQVGYPFLIRFIKVSHKNMLPQFPPNFVWFFGYLKKTIPGAILVISTLKQYESKLVDFPQVLRYNMS